MESKNSLMTAARENGFQSTRQQRCHAPTFHELISVTPAAQSKPEVVIDHSVENYRLLYGPGIEYVEQVLNYSKTHSLFRRGVCKLVVDPKNYIRLQRYPTGHQESSSLFNRLLEEGVEVIPLDDVLQYIKMKYPPIMKSLELLKKVSLKNTSGSIVSDDVYSSFFSYVIEEFLPDYAFSRDFDRNLKTVTVTNIHLLSSLFLPNSAGREDRIVELVNGYFRISNKIDMYFDTLMDGGTLDGLIFNVDDLSELDSVGPKGTIKLQTANLELFLKFGHDLFKWENSAGAARKRAKIFSDIVEEFISKAVFFPSAMMTSVGVDSASDVLDNAGGAMTLVKLVSEINQDLSNFCFIFPIEYVGQRYLSEACLDDFDQLLDRIFTMINGIANIRYMSPELKAKAAKYNVEWSESMANDTYCSYANCKRSTPKLTGQGYMFALQEPDILFFAKKRESLQGFIQSFALNDSDTIKAKYVFPVLIGHPNNFIVSKGPDYGFSRCSPLMNMSHIHRVLRGDLAEIVNVRREIIASYSPGAEYCEPLLEAPLLNDGYFFTSNDCLQAVRSAVPYGLLPGLLDGSASHFGLAYLVRNPMSRGIQAYMMGGWGGLLVSIVSLGLFRLPGYLRKGTLPGSLWRGCATIADVLGVALPFLSGKDVCQYAGGTLGFMVGKYGAENAWAWVLGPHDEDDRQRSRGRNRNLPPRERGTKRQGEAISKKTVSPEEALNRLILENSDKLARKSSEDLSLELTEYLQNLNKTIKDLNLSSLLLERLAVKLPWSAPMLGDVIAAHLNNMNDSQAKVRYIRERLEQYERHLSTPPPSTDTLSAAVEQFPGLYLLYLKELRLADIDMDRINRLWAVLNCDSPPDLLMHTGNRLIETHLCKTDSSAARRVLDDDKLTNKIRLDIFNDLSSTQVLLQNGVPEKLGSAYLEQVRLGLGRRKQDTKQHIIKAINIWLKKYSASLLTDNLIHLLIDFKRLAGNEDAETLLRFRTSLREQAIIEHSQGNNVQRRLRAKAILIALK